MGSSSEAEVTLCSALARRLETLLAENEHVRERVTFLEKTVRLVQADLERKRVLLRHFTGSLRGGPDEEVVTIEQIIEAAAGSAEGAQGQGHVHGAAAVLESVLKTLHQENSRLKRDLRALGEEVHSLKSMHSSDLSTSGVVGDTEAEDDGDLSLTGDPLGVIKPRSPRFEVPAS
jgi:predicted nuclease with TOPRIM domain